MLDPSPKSGSSSFTRKRTADIGGEQVVEVFDRVFLDRGGLRDAGIGHEDVQPLADERANLLGKRGGPFRRREVRLHRIRRSTCRANSGHQCVRLPC